MRTCIDGVAVSVRMPPRPQLTNGAASEEEVGRNRRANERKNTMIDIFFIPIDCDYTLLPGFRLLNLMEIDLGSWEKGEERYKAGFCEGF